jgi:hypothetical protein
MTGPNNYGHRMEVLLKFVKDNPRVKRTTIFNRLGSEYAYTFNRAKSLRKIVPAEDSSYKDKYWIVNGGER